MKPICVGPKGWCNRAAVAVAAAAVAAAFVDEVSVIEYLADLWSD
jgi:hypothetical protein